VRGTILIAAFVALLLSLCALAIMARSSVPLPSTSAARSPALPQATRSAAPARAEARPAAAVDAAVPRGARAIRKEVRRQLQAGLDGLQPALAVCSRGHAAGFGGTVLTLELTSLDGSIQIEDATELTSGAASAEVLACARDVLRGQRIPVSAAKAGPRVKMAFPLGGEASSDWTPALPPTGPDDDDS
jgi:hypothetical protein